MIRDVATGRYLDVDKLHYVDFESAAATATPSRGRPSFRVRCRASCRCWLRPACWARTSCPPGRRTPCSSPRPRPSCWPPRSPRPAAAAPAAAVIAELDVVLDSRGQSAAGRLAELDAHTPWQSSRARFVGTAAELTELLASVLGLPTASACTPRCWTWTWRSWPSWCFPPSAAAACWHRSSPDATFRELLGLPRPASRYAAAAAAVSHCARAFRGR